MKNKLEKFTVRQVKLDFCPTDVWLETRKTIKDSKCENCGMAHVECDGDIALATIVGRVNAHLCASCGQYYIDRGAIDIQQKIVDNSIIKEKLRKQCDRLGIRFNTYYSKKKYDEYSIDEIKQRISSAIKSERSNFHKFLELPPEQIKVLLAYVDEYNKRYGKVTAYDIWKDPSEFFADYTYELNRDSHRWIDYLYVKQNLGDKVFEYQWAATTGDDSIWDQGFEFDFSTLVEISKRDNISDIEMLNWLIDNTQYFYKNSPSKWDRDDAKNFIKDEIIRSIS